jgi:hypothetical protein
VVQHRRLAEGVLDVPLDRLQHPRRLLHPAHQRAARQPHPRQIGQQLLHTPQGQML